VEVDETDNLACPASPIHDQFDPVQTTKTSVHGAINRLGLAKRVKAKIFQAATSEVYGDPDIHPQPEHDWGNVNPIGPRSCYDEGKRCAETLFFDYRRQGTSATGPANPPRHRPKPDSLISGIPG
jgi:UDP-glucuronate decarboxylase